MKGFLYSESEIEHHADWLLFGPAIDLIDALSSKVRLRLLDIGCGSGAFGRMLEHRNIAVNYFGLDISHNNLQDGQKTYGLNRLLCGNILKLPFTDDTFEIVLSYGVVQSLPNLIKAIHELHRVCKSLCILEMVETPIGVNTFFEQSQNGFDEQIRLYNSDQLLSHLSHRGIVLPDKIISRTVHTDFTQGKPNYRNIPYLIRSIYIWGISCLNPS